MVGCLGKALGKVDKSVPLGGGPLGQVPALATAV